MAAEIGKEESGQGTPLSVQVDIEKHVRDRQMRVGHAEDQEQRTHMAGLEHEQLVAANQLVRECHA